MNFPAVTLAVLVFAALCAFVFFVLSKSSRDEISQPIRDLEKQSLQEGGARVVIKGVLFFFLAFFLSLPLTAMWARYEWPGDGQAYMAAVMVSVGIGVISAVCCCIYQLMKVNVGSESDKKFR